MRPVVQVTSSFSLRPTVTPLVQQCGFAVGVLSRDFALSMSHQQTIRSLEHVAADYGLTELM